MKTIMIMLDTVRKDHLFVYNTESTTKTPALNELANDSIVFNQHCTGSLPCMPARRDLFTGRLDFVERFWGSLEPFDTVLQKELSNNGVSSHIITDHAHYWRFGGEGYLNYFDTFEMVRGQESDPYISSMDEAAIPTETHGRFNLQYEKNSTTFLNIDDFPAMQTFNKAIDFIKLNKEKENFYLQVEGFDPHEPFDTPKEFMDMYNLNDIGTHYNSPKYGPNGDTEEQNDHIVKKYQANLTFADYAIGKLISTLKELGIYDECNIIFTSDHGFHLGEHGSLGKGVTHIYNEISNIPLFHKLPNQKERKDVNEFTQLIDVMPTILKQYKIEGEYKFHGSDYLQLLDGKVNREGIISGYFGMPIMYKNKEYSYFRKLNDKPKYMLTAVPTMMKGFIGSKYGMVPVDHSKIEVGRFLEHTDYPVYKFSFPSFFKQKESEVYETKDLEQVNNIIDKVDVEKLEKELKDRLLTLESGERVINDFL